ncbi:MAG: imidazole glycerol phosphate synthase subunit HisH [Pseudomonadota bacterium]
MTTVAVIDYGMGNLRSVCKAIEHVAPRARVELGADADTVRRADRVVFPGQGAIAGCMTALAAGRLHDALFAAMRDKPFLGICLGLQVLYESSEEGGGTACFGVLPGRVRRFPAPDGGDRLKIPHMGWNRVETTRPHRLWDGIASGERFYFVHSYYADSARSDDVAAQTEYGVRFTSAAARGNLFAVQFHPEKSQKAGLRLLENFMNWDGRD